MKKQKLIFLRGLPASGKTSYAKKYQAEHPGTKRVNKDELRKMIDDGKWSKSNEKFIQTIDELIVMKALAAGYDVIWDNTHLLPRDEAHVKHIANEFCADLAIPITLELFDMETSVSECLKRDAERENPVGAKVIQGMYERTKVTPEPYPVTPGLPWVVICDIDGTLAIKGNRDQYDETKVELDTVNPLVQQLLCDMNQDEIYMFMFLSGRKRSCGDATFQWLTDWLPLDRPKQLLMRSDDDKRPDEEVKRELFEKCIRGKFNVKYVIDDRKKVCRMWYRLGLPLLMVGDPDSDF